MNEHGSSLGDDSDLFLSLSKVEWFLGCLQVMVGEMGWLNGFVVDLVLVFYD